MTTADKLLVRAERYLTSAAILITSGDFESAVSRSYYAMFYAARAALSVRGMERGPTPEWYRSLVGCT
jgi:uncharacterized protein (UPF0332 family)